MTTSDYSYRFGGVERLYSKETTTYLSKCHICIIGIGGVGSWAAEAIARSGVGSITLIDLDDICVSNTNRQIHADSSSVGKMKVDVMAQRIQLINPEARVHSVHGFISPKNMAELITKDMDYVIDAIDSVKAKTALLAHCKRNKVKIITVGGAGGQKDPTRIEIADITKAYQDPLLAKVRNKLRKEYNFSSNSKRKFGIDCVFSSEPLSYPQADGSVCQQKPAESGPTKLDCATGFGASVMVTASFGLFAASRAINKLAERYEREKGEADKTKK